MGKVGDGVKILLNIEQEVSDVTETAINGGLITTENKIITQIMAEDGEIVVLGGLMEETANETKNKVPVLGSIPLLGYFFKYQSTNIEKKNLMVFLRAKIVRDGEVMNAATAEKYSKMRDLQLEHREKGLPLANDKYVPVLPEVEFKDLQTEDEGESGE
jgi:general secretion pathway protein D